MEIHSDFVYMNGSIHQNKSISINEQGFITEINELVNNSKKELHKYRLIIPGFVNAHCHLELAHLKNQLPRGLGMTGFISEIIRKRDTVTKIDKINAIARAIEENRQCGTVCIGDIINDHSLILEMQKYSSINIHHFYELYDIHLAKTQFTQTIKKIEEIPLSNTLSLAAHSPYTVSSNYWKEILNFNAKNNTPTSVHMLESVEEVDFYSQKGCLHDILSKSINYKSISCSPFAGITNFASKEQSLLYVHMTQAKKEHVEVIKEITPNYYICLCPKSNQFIHSSLPPVHIFNLDRLCIGTDSIASNTSYSILEELYTLQNEFPQISLAKYLNIAIEQGYSALGKSFSQEIIKGGNRIPLFHITHLKEDQNGLKLTSESEVVEIGL